MLCREKLLWDFEEENALLEVSVSHREKSSSSLRTDTGEGGTPCDLLCLLEAGVEELHALLRLAVRSIAMESSEASEGGADQVTSRALRLWGDRYCRWKSIFLSWLLQPTTPKKKSFDTATVTETRMPFDLKVVHQIVVGVVVVVGGGGVRVDRAPVVPLRSSPGDEVSVMFV